MVNIRKINKESLGRYLIPEKLLTFNYRHELEKIYEKLYFDNINYNFITNLFAISIFSSIIIYTYVFQYIYSYFNNFFYNFLSSFIIVLTTYMIILFFSYYFILFLAFFRYEAIFKKDEEDIEKDLPDYLDNLISNMKGGISIEKALLKSVSKEQKALLREVTLVNQKILMGDTVCQALEGFRERFDSAIIERTFFLIEEGLKNGGNIIKPLERISENLKNIYNLNNELKANSGGFVTVIYSITIFVSPLLFALALTLLTFLGNLFKLLSKSQENLSFTVSEIPAEYTDYLILFSYSMIMLITFFSSLITAELKNEKLHDSIKYLPIYIVISLVFFRFVSNLLLNFFSSIL